MTDYAKLKARLDDRQVVRLDGAVGTQLQGMGVPMNKEAWAAVALETHPDTVRRMHEKYVDAGVDVITVNTYSAARHNLEPLGLGDHTFELNLRAVVLAQEAVARRAGGRPVWIAGSVSNFGLVTGSEHEQSGRKHRMFSTRSRITEAQAKNNLREQAAILADAGVDLVIAEPTGSNTQRRWVVEACLSTGLPVWTGFKVHLDEGGAPKVGYHSDVPLEAEFAEIAQMGGAVVNVFHSSIAATNAALPIVRSHWKGPIGIYPEAERTDYVLAWRNVDQDTPVTPAQFADQAGAWVEQGVQIIGGCCGIELDHIRALEGRLPERIPAAA